MHINGIVQSLQLEQLVTSFRGRELSGEAGNLVPPQ